LLDGSDGATDIEYQAVGSGMGHGEAMRLGEAGQPFVVGWGGTKLLGKLLDGEEFAVVGAGGVVELLEEALEFWLIS
jgi:hypothetical protein